MLAYTTPARGEVIPARRGVGCLFREWVFGDTSCKINRMFPTLFYFKFVRSIIRKTKCSSVLKQNVLFYKTKRTSVNLFSYPNWHKKAPKKYVFFGAFYCSVFWLSHQKSLTLNKYIIFGFNAILIPLKRRYIIPPESWARHRLYSIMSVYVAL